MSLLKIADNLYTFEFKQKIMPGVHFPARSTIIKMDGGEVAIISPGPFTPEAVGEIKKLGDSFYIIAPNLFHHFYFLKAAESFPKHRLFGPHALGKKIKHLAGQFEDLATLPKSVISHLAPQKVEGNKAMQEWVFFHGASKTLIVTDLVFNMKDKPLLTRMVLGMAGAYNKLGQSKLVKMITDDKELFSRSIQSLASYDLQRLIMAHGDIIDDGSEWKDFASTYKG